MDQTILTFLETNMSPPQGGCLEDDFPFVKVGYVSLLSWMGSDLEPIWPLALDSYHGLVLGVLTFEK